MEIVEAIVKGLARSGSGDLSSKDASGNGQSYYIRDIGDETSRMFFDFLKEKFSGKTYPYEEIKVRLKVRGHDARVIPPRAFSDLHSRGIVYWIDTDVKDAACYHNPWEEGFGGGDFDREVKAINPFLDFPVALILRDTSAAKPLDYVRLCQGWATSPLHGKVGEELTLLIDGINEYFNFARISEKKVHFIVNYVPKFEGDMRKELLCGLRESLGERLRVREISQGQIDARYAS